MKQLHASMPLATFELIRDGFMPKGLDLTKIDIKEYASKKNRSEMKTKGVKTAQICKLLKDTFNVSLNVQSFNNKISRANFSATFFFQCMYVLETRFITFDIDSIGITKDEK